MEQLENDLVVGDWVVPKNFISDGCTMPWGLGWLLKRILRSGKFRNECILHDFMRRHLVFYKVVTVKHADHVFKRLIREKSNWFYSRIYWYGARFGRDKYSKTEPFPILEWNNYIKPRSDIWTRLTKGV